MIHCHGDLRSGGIAFLLIASRLAIYLVKLLNSPRRTYPRSSFNSRLLTFHLDWYNRIVEIHQITNRNKLAAYFRQDIPTHAYSLGDLDDFYWSKTTYYGEIQGENVSHVTALYCGEGLPVLLALGPVGFFTGDYYRLIKPRLPNMFYAHLSPGLEGHFQQDYEIINHGLHFKMSLADPASLGSACSDSCLRLDASHIPALQELYQLSYPDNSFDPNMVLTGKYFGSLSGERLVSVAGVHVYSRVYRVAALGNITTLPEHRNKGFGRLVTSCLCRDLVGEVDFIGLNVKGDNLAALQLYGSLGFKIKAKYGEFTLKKRV